MCGRLNDVPTLDELAALDDDGTLKLAPPPPPNPRLTLDEAGRAFGRSRRDNEGQAIDLRPTVDDLRDAGAPPEYEQQAGAGSPGTRPVPARPRYDPLTGELIRPLELAPADGPERSPSRRSGSDRFAAGPGQRPVTGDGPAAPAGGAAGVEVPSYEALAEAMFPPPSLPSLPLRLLEPVNLAVMLFAVFILLLLQLLLGPVLLGLWFIAPLPTVAAVLLLAHYANCVDDLGPGHQDELPRLLRSAELGPDIVRPFFRIAAATALAFGPAAAALSYLDGPARFIATGVLLAAGLLLYPAMVLVTCVSQHPGNLGPVRLLGTIATLGPAYLLAVVVATAAAAAHAVTLVATADSLARLVDFPGPLSKVLSLQTSMAIAATGTLLSVYLGHLAAWTLGLLYRRNEGRFPWIFDELERQRQEHKRLKVLAELEKTRARTQATHNV
ncbi:MAG: hypothetical protein ACK4PI_11120 [Tepidisphaerales bacterium]